MNAVRNVLSWFSPKLPVYLTYMLQQVEYNPAAFLDWVQRLMDLASEKPLMKVMHRQQLVMTKVTRLFLSVGYASICAWFAVIATLIIYLPTAPLSIVAIVICIFATPFVVVVVYLAIISVADLFFVEKREKNALQRVKNYLETHPAKIIVIAGSYGKTTMKELLTKVLAGQFRVAATPGNGNTPSAHAKFVSNLEGAEEFLIFELGEGKPGDIQRFAEALHPDYAIITGLAPNHLDRYKTVDALAEDILSLRDFVGPQSMFVSGDSPILKKYTQATDQIFDEQGGAGWNNTSVHIYPTLTTFEVMVRGKVVLVSSRLVGRHQVAPLGLAVNLAISFGMNIEDISKILEQVVPYEHRMQPYSISGATIIDDTYNGNLEGILAGLRFLSEIEAKRKVYVTPGLVDQGQETEEVHKTIAATLAHVKPDWLVLMKNSATKIIKDELNRLGYQGRVSIEPEPLVFYQNLDQVVRAGDVVLMQNDWTDNYH